MKIGIDGHTIGNQRSGDESYTLGLIKGLSSIDNTNKYTIYTTNDSASDILGPIPDNFIIKKIWPHNRWARIMFSYPLSLYYDQQDIVHFQYIAPLYLNASLVLTIHDISYRVFPEYYNPVERFMFNLATPVMLNRANKIITVSDFSKSQLVNYYNVSSDKIFVTYNSIGEKFKISNNRSESEKILENYGIDKKFILYVGNLTQRKKPDVLIKAYMKILTARKINCDLVLVGKKKGMYSKLFSLVKKFKLENKVKFLGYVPDKDLSCLYQRAKVFVYPSIYEGFGIPVLEAMYSGTPVICCEKSSLGEVAGDAAIKLKELNTDSLAEAILLIFKDENLCNTLIQRGIERAKLFSWAETARKTLCVYEKVYQNKMLS